jgi:mannose-6-phosphate isomerase-like protein (cupin superfamily)
MTERRDMSDQLQITPAETLEVIEHTPAVLVLEAAYAPRGSAPPAHYHPRQDEHFEILEGTLRIEVSGVERDLSAGETLDIPRGTSHRMWNPGARPARARWETRPAGRTEEWFTALAALQGTPAVDASGRPKVLPFAALAHEYRDTFRLAAGPDPATKTAVRALALAANATGRTPKRPRRDLGALSGPLAGVSFIGGLVAGLAVARAPYPQPGTRPAAIRRYFQSGARGARISVAGQLISAASLARFTVSVAGLARGSGRGSPALRAATGASGGLATASLAGSALTALALTGRAGHNRARMLVLHRRVFVLGGPLHTAAFGALVGCLSIAGHRTGRLPRPLTIAGLASAATGTLSPLGLVVPSAALLIPAGRISGLAICGIAGARLSQSPCAPEQAGQG